MPVFIIACASDAGRTRARSRLGPGYRQQAGMAVVAALLVVTAVTVIAAALMQRQSTFLRAVQSAQTRAEAQWVLRGGLNWARHVLRADGQRNATTRLDELWAAPIIDARLADLRPGVGGTFTGKIEDEQGKFNLRNLVFRSRLSLNSVEEFQRLCALLNVSADVANRIAQRVLIAQPAAAEDEGDATGGSMTPGGGLGGPVQAPLPRSLDDLRSLEGVDGTVIAKLRSHVTILPRVTLVNVNTATAEVIASRVPNMTLDQAKAIVSQRNAGQWFVNEADFVNRLNMPELRSTNVGVGVSSAWFTVAGAARQGRSVLLIHALLQRVETDLPRVIWSREGA